MSRSQVKDVVSTEFIYGISSEDPCVKAVGCLVGELLVRCPQSRCSLPFNSNPETDGLRFLYERRLANDKLGCPWQGALSSREHHVKYDCGLTMTACPNADKGCLNHVQRQLMAKHLEICPYEYVPCDECDQAGICRGQMAAHLDVCMFVMVSCVNGCGANHFRQAKENHEAVCPEALVICPFVSHGCDATSAMRRCVCDTHQVTAALKHSRLVAVAMSSLKEEVANMKKNQGNGEANFVWHASVDKLRLSPKHTHNSKKFSVHVPGAGEYKGYLQICIEREGCIGFYMYINEGPKFPIFVEYADFTCGEEHSLRLFSHFPVIRGVGRGFSSFLTDEQAQADMGADGCLPITAKIKLKCDCLISLDDM